VHVGTAERLGRLTVLDSGDANPAEGPTYCHVRLDEPVQVMRGDHFVVRDASARRTIGGGVVVHPWPRVRRRRDPRRQATIAALDRGAAPDAARTFLDDSEAFALPISRLRHFLNTSEEAVRALVGQAGGLRVFTLEDDRLVATDGKWRRLEAAVDATLQTFHDAHPRLPGMEMEALRGTLPFDVPPRLFRAVLDQLAAAAVVLRDGNVVRLAGHVVRLQHDDQDLADRIRTLLGAQALAPPELALLEKTLGLGRSRALELLRVLERDGSIVRVTNDLYVERAAIDRLKAEMAAHFPAASEVTPAAFRERFGTSRKYTIPLLEFLDREGITVRTGELRRMRHAPTATGR
jgi:selenocysteine-specific elongation factor